MTEPDPDAAFQADLERLRTALGLSHDTEKDNDDRPQ